MGNRFLILLLLVMGLFMGVVSGLFIHFDALHITFNGTLISIFLVLFTISIFMVIPLLINDFKNYISFPIFGSFLIGIKTFYDIFVSTEGYDLTSINPSLKYGFNYFIHYTFFTDYTIETFKYPDAIVYFISIGLLVIGGLIVYLVQGKKVINS